MISNLCSGCWDCVHYVMLHLRALSWNASMYPLKLICTYSMIYASDDPLVLARRWCLFSSDSADASLAVKEERLTPSTFRMIHEPLPKSSAKGQKGEQKTVFIKQEV